MALNSEDIDINQMDEKILSDAYLSFEQIQALMKTVASLYPAQFCKMVLEAKKDADEMKLDIELERVIVEHNNQLINDGDIEVDEFPHRV